MYIKLTRLDGAPIWINAAFVVTIEQRRDGGAVVVPIGDGLDYDVRESADVVLGMLADAPVPTVVPVPPPKSLASAPAEVNEKPQPVEVAPEKEMPAEKPAKKTKTTRTTATKKPRTTRAKKSVAEKAPVDTPAKETVSADEAKPVENATQAWPVAPVAPAADAPSASAEIANGEMLTDDYIVRLRKMAPGSVRKLGNTLSAQFRVYDVDGAVAELVSRDVIVVDDQGRILWK